MLMQSTAESTDQCSKCERALKEAIFDLCKNKHQIIYTSESSNLKVRDTFAPPECKTENFRPFSGGLT